MGHESFNSIIYIHTNEEQELLTQDVSELIEELRLQRPILFGHSNGALIAAHVAATFPELVNSIILEDPPWRESSWEPSATTDVNEPWPGFTAWYNAWVAWHKGQYVSFEKQVI